MTKELATEFAESWNTHNADTVVSYFAEDGVFCMPDKQRYVGHAALKEFIADFFENCPDVHFTMLGVHISDDGSFGVFESEIEGLMDEVVVGIDFLKFDGDKVAFKDAFHKQYSS